MPAKFFTIFMLILLSALVSSAQAATRPLFPVVLDPALTTFLCELNLTPQDNGESYAQAIMARFQRPDVTAHFAALGLKTDIGVLVQITDDRGRVLMGERQGSFGAGEWAAPGGHVEPDEVSPFETADREVREETGVSIGTKYFIGATLETYPHTGKAYLTIHVGTSIVSGSPRTMEPNKLRGNWQWFRPENLPSPLFRPVVNYRAAGGAMGGRHLIADQPGVGTRSPLTPALRDWQRRAYDLGTEDITVIRQRMGAVHEDLLQAVHALSDVDLISEVTLLIERYQAQPRNNYLPGLTPEMQMTLNLLIQNYRQHLREIAAGAALALRVTPHLVAVTGNLNIASQHMDLIAEDSDEYTVTTAEAQEIWLDYISGAYPFAVFNELQSRISP